MTFTPEVFDIWDQNTTDVLKKVENIIKSWSRRKITLPGKITVIKSLAISKFVHLFLALPNPPGNLVQSLNKLFYKFLWNSGPDKIKRKIIIKDIIKGGLRMIQIDSFVTALKVTWLRQLFTKGNNYAGIKANE